MTDPLGHNLHMTGWCVECSLTPRVEKLEEKQTLYHARESKVYVVADDRPKKMALK